jgi:hypothetical protein
MAEQGHPTETGAYAPVPKNHKKNNLNFSSALSVVTGIGRLRSAIPREPKQTKSRSTSSLSSESELAVLVYGSHWLGKEYIHIAPDW